MGFLKNLFHSLKSDSAESGSATPVCGKCGIAVKTNAKRREGDQRIAKKYGGYVREDGRVAAAVAEPGQTEEIRRNLQRDLDENFSRCGFRCMQCGKIFCYTCLIRDAEELPFFGGKACVACGGSVQAIDDPIVQAEHYIISIVAPEPDPAKRDVLIQGILALNGYVKGPAGVRFAVFASEAGSLESLTVGLMFTLEQESGMEIDRARTKIHSFSRDAIRGTMIALFHTGKPCVRKAAPQSSSVPGRIQ